MRGSLLWSGLLAFAIGAGAATAGASSTGVGRQHGVLPAPASLTPSSPATAGSATTTGGHVAVPSTRPPTHAVQTAHLARVALGTRHYTVNDWTSHNIVLTGTSGDFEAPGTPNGKVIAPGQSWGFEVNFPGVGYAHFNIVDDNNSTLAKFDVTLAASAAPGLPPDKASACTVGSPFQCTADGSNLTVLDPPNTSYTIPAVQAQWQARWLLQLCENGTAANCIFQVDNEVHTWTGPHQVSDAISNPTDHAGKFTYKVEDTVGRTDSVGVEIKAGTKLFNAVDVSITGKYEHEWTAEHSVTEIIEWDVPPHTRLYISAVDPIIRDTGTFKITLGNTTWTLLNVYFDSPDVGSNSWHDYMPVEQRLS